MPPIATLPPPSKTRLQRDRAPAGPLRRRTCGRLCRRPGLCCDVGEGMSSVTVSLGRYTPASLDLIRPSDGPAILISSSAGAFIVPLNKRDEFISSLLLVSEGVPPSGAASFLEGA